MQFAPNFPAPFPWRFPIAKHLIAGIEIGVITRWSSHGDQISPQRFEGPIANESLDCVRVPNVQKRSNLKRLSVTLLNWKRPDRSSLKVWVSWRTSEGRQIDRSLSSVERIDHSLFSLSNRSNSTVQIRFKRVMVWNSNSERFAWNWRMKQRKMDFRMESPSGGH